MRAGERWNLRAWRAVAYAAKGARMRKEATERADAARELRLAGWAREANALENGAPPDALARRISRRAEREGLAWSTFDDLAFLSLVALVAVEA